MTRYLYLLTFVAFSATPMQAQERIFEVEPGRWRFEDSFTVSGLHIADTHTATQCLSEAEAHKSLSEIISDMTGGRDSDCTVSNLSDLPGKVSLDISCQTDEAGVLLQSNGSMSYEYNRTRYSGVVSGEMILRGRRFPYEGQAFAERIGDC
jgi:hypothetical protein